MKIAFYKGRTRLFNRLVSWFDRSPYSHCEVVLDSATGLCGSSSFMDGGVRTKVIDLDSGHWDVVDIGGSEQTLEAVYLWFATHAGQGYDVLGLVGFLWRRQTGQKSKWFCSEAVAAALGMREPWRLDPATLYAVATADVPRWPATRASALAACCANCMSLVRKTTATSRRGSDA